MPIGPAVPSYIPTRGVDVGVDLLGSRDRIRLAKAGEKNWSSWEFKLREWRRLAIEGGIEIVDRRLDW